MPILKAKKGAYLYEEERRIIVSGIPFQSETTH